MADLSEYKSNQPGSRRRNKRLWGHKVSIKIPDSIRRQPADFSELIYLCMKRQWLPYFDKLSGRTCIEHSSNLFEIALELPITKEETLDGKDESNSRMCDSQGRSILTFFVSAIVISASKPNLQKLEVSQDNSEKALPAFSNRPSLNMQRASAVLI